jgi:histone-lysine N-methyltransferase SETMAR
MWTVGTWHLHYDNAPAHTVLSIREFLAKHLIPVLPQPPYSPDLSPPDFFQFRQVKMTLR